MAKSFIPYEDIEFTLEDIKSYLLSCTDTERKAYTQELAQTGIFHDAIGKVIDVQDNGIVVLTEY